MWQKIVNWAKSKGGWAHIVAVVYAGAVLAYSQVPAFTTVCNNVYNAIPSWGHQLILAGTGLYAWYKTTNK